MGWLFRTVVGAAITAVVGFAVTKYLESASRSGRARAEIERRTFEPRRSDVYDARALRRVER